MKKVTIHFMIFFTTFTVFSQNNEIGIFAGGSNYIGDVGPTTYIHPFSYNISTNVVAGIIYRKNLNERIALRGKLIMQRLEVLTIGQKLQNTENKEVNISKTQLKN